MDIFTRIKSSIAGDSLSVPLNTGRNKHLYSTNPSGVYLQETDALLIWFVTVLLAWGLVMVYSASIAFPDGNRYTHTQPEYYLWRHLAWIFISIIGAYFIYLVPTDFWHKKSKWLLVFCCFLMVLVIIPGIGIKVKGASRWIGYGAFRFQPAELAKVVMILFASSHMLGKMNNIKEIHKKEPVYKTVGPILGFLILLSVIVYAQSDLGTISVLFIIVLGILFLSGVSWSLFAFLAASMIIYIIATIKFGDAYRLARITAYLNPWDAKNMKEAAFQLTNSLMAIGQGQVFGVGLGGGIEKLHWLPEMHTDFILASIGEEFGLIGFICLITIYVCMLLRIIKIGQQASMLDRVYSGLIAQGIAIWLGFQAFFHIAVNIGVLPTKGITLPFMSYGGSALLMNLVAIAIVLRVDKENRLLARGFEV